MADKKDEKPKIDFNTVGSRLKEHAEGEHLDEITERLSSVYTSHKKSVGNRRKLNEEEAEKLGHQLYDELINYITEYYNIKPEEIKALKSKKGKHNDSLLDSLVENHFGLSRNDFTYNLRKRAESGEKFSNKYIIESLNKNIEHYNKKLQQRILGDLRPEHMEDVRKQIEYFIDKHKLDKSKYKSVLKSKDFDEIAGTYAQLASNFYAKEEKKEGK